MLNCGARGLEASDRACKSIQELADLRRGAQGRIGCWKGVQVAAGVRWSVMESDGAQMKAWMREEMRKRTWRMVGGQVSAQEGVKAFIITREFNGARDGGQ